RIASGAALAMLVVRLATMTIAMVVAAGLAIGTERAYARPAASADVQIGPSPDAQPGIRNREVEQAAAILARLARSNFGNLDDAELKLVHAAPQRALMWAGPSNDGSSPLNDPS